MVFPSRPFRALAAAPRNPGRGYRSDRLLINEGNVSQSIVFLERDTIAPEVVIRRPSFAHSWAETIPAMECAGGRPAAAYRRAWTKFNRIAGYA